jgi:hypothetical protein
LMYIYMISESFEGSLEEQRTLWERLML